MRKRSWFYRLLERLTTIREDEARWIYNESGYYTTGPASVEAAFKAKCQVHEVQLLVLFDQDDKPPYPKIVSATDEEGHLIELHLLNPYPIEFSGGSGQVAQIVRVTPADKPDTLLTDLTLSNQSLNKFKFVVNGIKSDRLEA